MTWSIIARDPETAAVGIAVASRFFAAGALVPWIDPEAGAIATQALVNATYGPRGLDLLRQGRDARSVVTRLTEADAGAGQRQLHVMDRTGAFAAHTGADCIGWCGHVIASDCSVAGNMLAGAAVIAATAEAYRAGAALPFARRLIAAMKAGEAEGGDKRGRQSAAVLIHTTESHPFLSMRVDDHADPLAELERLEQVSRERYVHMAKLLPTRADPVGCIDRAAIDRTIAEAVAREAAR